MSTRKAIIILSLTLLAAVLLLTRFGTRLPFLSGEKEDPYTKPDSRPERPDLELLDKPPNCCPLGRDATGALVYN